MNEISNKTVVALLVATIIVSLGGTFIALGSVSNKLSSLGLGPITGFAIGSNASTTVTVQTFSSIKFSQASVAFGSGSVNTTGGFNNCTLSTTDSNSSGCTDFSEVSNGFTIENDGNSNLTVQLRSNISAADFIGVDTAKFLWNVTVNETGSCRNNTGQGIIQPNTTGAGNDCGDGNTSNTAGEPNNCGNIFEPANTSNRVICPRLLFADGSDALNIDINISIPADAPAGQKVAGIFITGTRNPTS